ncbi:MAG: succinoglycan biosynthesis protein ExoM [Gemmatimonadaceae bacterium]|nr:succinoglycan biosynthesis protein ExoM [Gemmatimonadaceae bacterium]
MNLAVAPSISVVICTWNRSSVLRQTLEQMTLLDVPAEIQWELIVVNNNCSDDTDSVLASFEGRLPLLRLFEPTPGKSHAANLAVREAKGEYMVWTDDDVLVDPNWLKGYLAAFAKWPDATLFAGAIDPWFEGRPPLWLEQVFPHVANAYAALDHGPIGFAMTRDTYPYGANMALKRAAHLREPYDTRLGPRPNSGIRGEEMVLARRLLSSGDTGRWVPEARVRHFIPIERQTLTYLRQYFFGSGEVLGIMGKRDPEEHLALGRPLWLWKEALLSEIHYRAGRIFRSPDKWIVAFKNANVARGRLKTYASAGAG